MGYTGSIIFNGEHRFSEWKSDNTFFCQKYPETFIRRKPCLVDIDAINKTCGMINGSCTGYGWIAHEIISCMKVISSLTNVMHNEHMFDRDGRFTGVIKMQNEDASGNARAIYFYYEGHVSNVQEASIYERVFLTDKDMQDIKRKRYDSVVVTDISAAFSDLHEGWERHELMASEIMRIKSMDDISRILRKMNEAYGELHEIYKEKWNLAMLFSKLAKEFNDLISAGKKVYARYEDGCMCFNCDGIEWFIETDDFFAFSYLFEKNGIEPCGASLEITDRDELDRFIQSFPENDKYSSDFEAVVVGIYNEVVDGRPFSLKISGGF